MQTVKVLRSFNKTPQGDLAEIGETIEVEDNRAQELSRLGLAEPVKAGAKAAEAPENKQAPEPENKDGVAKAEQAERRTRRTAAREPR